jgi:hypothetical protein
VLVLEDRRLALALVVGHLDRRARSRLLLGVADLETTFVWAVSRRASSSSSAAVTSISIACRRCGTT